MLHNRSSKYKVVYLIYARLIVYTILVLAYSKSYIYYILLIMSLLSQTSFSLYYHNQWTDFHKISCAEKPQMKAIYTYVGYTKATTNNWDIRPLVTVKALSANISWTAEWIHMIELVLESAHQSIYNNI